MCSLQADIDEALRLIRMSKVSLFEDEGADGGVDPISAIYTAIRDNAVLTGKQTFLWAELVTLLGRSYSVRTQRRCQRLACTVESGLRPATGAADRADPGGRGGVRRVPRLLARLPAAERADGPHRRAGGLTCFAPPAACCSLAAWTRCLTQGFL